MKKMYIWLVILLISIFTVWAHGEETFENAEHIIEEKIPCEQLNDGQLEDLGDYYMEQMHQGESHIRMDSMMGGQGSENLKQMHISMGERFYCGNTQGMMSGAMMPMMGGMMGSGAMMGNNMLNSQVGVTQLIFPLIFGILLIGVIILALLWMFKKTGPNNDALSTLKKRLADGEITISQYNSLKKEVIGGKKWY